jgi:hypothetical protein
VTDPRVRQLFKQVAAIAAGESTFDDAVDQLVALAEGERSATGPQALSPEDAASFRALTAMFVREALRARCAHRRVRAPTAREQEAHAFWIGLLRELIESGSHL